MYKFVENKNITAADNIMPINIIFFCFRRVIAYRDNSLYKHGSTTMPRFNELKNI